MSLKNIFIILTIFISVIFYSCESNDNPSGSTYIPQAVNKKVLVEFFTNSGCTPCVEVHNYFDQVTRQGGVTINDTSVILISYHYRFPYPGDSLYLTNKADNDKRAAYYNIGFTPNVWLEGTFMGGFSAGTYTSLIDARMNTTKFADIILLNNYNENDRTGTATVNIDLINNLPTSDIKLFVLFTESDIHYEGTNGISVFDDVVRDIITDANGDDVNLSVGMNTFNVNYTLNLWIEDDNTFLIAYVQSASTKEVYAVEKIKFK